MRADRSPPGFTTLWNYTTLKHPYQGIHTAHPFYYLMELHYSQTWSALQVRELWFYYLMELHYSQTMTVKFGKISEFYYLMELHYSQTLNSSILFYIAVLLPYGITLLSNRQKRGLSRGKVLLPYGITLLSNDGLTAATASIVLLPYGITLLSNGAVCPYKRS